MNINLPPGTYIITAEYKGLRMSNTIKVLTVLEAKDLVMKYHDGYPFKAKVLDGQADLMQVKLLLITSMVYSILKLVMMMELPA